MRFRCHTGHACTASPLLAAVMECAGEMIWQVVHRLEEGMMLLDSMGSSLREAGDFVQAETFLSRARLLERQSRTFQEAAVEHGRAGTEQWRPKTGKLKCVQPGQAKGVCTAYTSAERAGSAPYAEHRVNPSPKAKGRPRMAAVCIPALPSERGSKPGIPFETVRQ